MKCRNNLIIIFFLPVFIFLSINCAQKEARIKNVRVFIKNWNYDRALAEIISYREDKDPEIQYLLGYCYLMKNEFQEAVKYFSNSLATGDIFKDSIVGLYNTLAQNALKINEPERTLFFYQTVAKLVPAYDLANNLFTLGDLYFNQGNYPSAVEAYTEALRIDSSSKQAKDIRPKLIKAYAESGKLPLALQLAQAEYERLKTAANLLQLTEIKFARAKELFDNDSLDSAKIYFEEIIGGNEPKSFLDDAYYYIGEIYLNKKMFKEALESYKKVLRLNPYEKGEIVKKSKARINEIKEKT